MRYCMTLYLKDYQKSNNSKLKLQLLLSKCKSLQLSSCYCLLHWSYQSRIFLRIVPVSQQSTPFFFAEQQIHIRHKKICGWKSRQFNFEYNVSVLHEWVGSKDSLWAKYFTFCQFILYVSPLSDLLSHCHLQNSFQMIFESICKHVFSLSLIWFSQ